MRPRSHESMTYNDLYVYYVNGCLPDCLGYRVALNADAPWGGEA